MGCAAFITYSLAFIVYADRVKFTQYVTAFSANTYDGFKAISAEGIFFSVYRMLPYRDVSSFIAEITSFHPEPFCEK